MSLLDRVIFLPTRDGTGDFVVYQAVKGYQTPASAGAVDGATYSYVAEQRSHANVIIDWEVGQGTWTAATSTLARTTVLFSSQSGNKINFAEPPQVMITALAEDLPIKLPANTTFNVGTSGNDTTGNGTSSKPWATLQKAIDYLSANVNLNNKTATIQLGAGSFAGAGMKAVAGNGFVYINGAGVGSTTITGGPNDGVYNFGECLGATVIVPTNYYLNNVTLDISAGTAPCILMENIATLIIGVPFNGAGAVNFKGCASHFCVELFDSDFDDGVGSSIGISGNCLGFLQASDEATASVECAYTLTGTPVWGSAFLNVYNQAMVVCNGFSVSGSATGKRFNATSSGLITGTGANINLFPGSTAGTCTDGGRYSA